MTDSEFHDLALRVADDTATAPERTRFEELLASRADRRQAWADLRAELAAAREAFAVAAELSEGAIRERPPVAPSANRPGWQRSPRLMLGGLGLAAAALVILHFAFGGRRTGLPEVEAPPSAFVIPRGGGLTVVDRNGTCETDRPVAVSAGATVATAAGHEAWLLSADGRMASFSGRRQIPDVVAAGPAVRWLTAPLVALAPLARTRASEGLQIFAPRGATVATEPLLIWAARRDCTYEVELRDALNEAAPPARVSQVRPPLHFANLERGALTVGGIYILTVAETGQPLNVSSVRFMVVAPAAGRSDPTDPAGRLVEACQALTESPARFGDAWVHFSALPPEWQDTELGRRLAAAISSP